MPPKEDPTKPPKDKKTDPIVKAFAGKKLSKKKEDELPEEPEWASLPAVVPDHDPDTGELFEVQTVVFKPNKKRMNKGSFP